MKPIKLLFIFIAFGLFSCDNLTEEIHVNKDGSGTYKMYSDMVPSVRKMVIQMRNIDNDSDSNSKSVDELVWADFPGKIDSTIDFTKDVPDSEWADPAKKKILEKINGFMEGGRQKGYVNVGIKYHFKDPDELDKLMNLIEENRNSSEGGSLLPNFYESSTDVNYEMNGRKFIRKTEMTKKPELEKSEEATLEAMFVGAKMRTIVHMPGKIKKVKGDHILEIKDSTVTFEYSILKSIKGEINSDFEIIMEK